MTSRNLATIAIVIAAGLCFSAVVDLWAWAYDAPKWASSLVRYVGALGCGAFVAAVRGP